MYMERKNIITRSEFNEISQKLNELIDLIDKFDYLHNDVDDLFCLSHSLFLLEHNKVENLKLID